MECVRELKRRLLQIKLSSCLPPKGFELRKAVNCWGIFVVDHYWMAKFFLCRVGGFEIVLFGGFFCKKKFEYLFVIEINYIQ